MKIGLKFWHSLEYSRNWIAKTFFNPYDVEPYGFAPVQADGILPDGSWYYFRARGHSWIFETASSEIEWMRGETTFFFRQDYGCGDHFDASSMPHYHVIKFTNQAIKLYETSKSANRR